MRSFVFLTAALLVSGSVSVLSAQMAAPPGGKAGGAADYKDEAVVWEHADTVYRMRADGTGYRSTHVVARVQSEGSARQFGVVSVAYSAAYETAVFDLVRVHKADGSTVDTPVDEAIEMPAAVTREAPLYSDLKEKQLPVRSVAAGDTIEYQFHADRTKAEAPGQFWGADHFMVRAGVILSQTLTLEVPAEKYVQVWSPHHPAAVEAKGGVKVYRWSSSQLRPTGKSKEVEGAKTASDEVKDPDEDVDGLPMPSVAWTTFRSWAEVGDWYRGLSLVKSEPSAAVKAKAEELTKGAKTPEEQVRVLYEFVSARMRYVGIDFGIGRFQPHTADEVLDHQYGDCKDKDTLLEALLRAKGFVTAPALIGAGIAAVPEAPSPALANHVITTVELPGGRVWLDATPEVEPYRVLLPLIRDKEALLVPAQGEAHLEKTPADPPFPYEERFEARATLDKDGLLKGHMEMTLRSDSEFGVRLMLTRLAPAQWDEAMQAFSTGVGFSGTVSHADFKQKEAEAPVHIGYDYSRASFADWENRRILPLFPVLDLAGVDKDKEPERDIDLGSVRTLTAVTRIELPVGFRADLPNAIHARRAYATFDQTYKMEGTVLTVDRKVVVLKKKVSKGEWKDYYAWMKESGLVTGENYIALLAPAATEGPGVEKAVKAKVAGASGELAAVPAAAPTAPAPIPGAAAASAGSGAGDDAGLAAKMQEAGELEKQNDWTGARRKLEEVQAARADYPYVQAMLAGLDVHDNKKDQAVEELKAELKAHPEANTNVLVMLASLYIEKKQWSEEAAFLKGYENRDDVRIAVMRAGALRRLNDGDGELAEWERVQKDHPENRELGTSLADCLRRLKREDEAAKAALAAMDGSDDASILNNNSYLLAEVKREMPLAEKNSRRAVTLLETASAGRSVQEANSQSFAEAALLIASWDTLGWVLYAEGKTAEAEPYLAAAWFERPNVEIGSHLAQVREALGKRSEALLVDQMALASEGAAKNAEAFAAVSAQVARLQKAGVHGTASNMGEKLQEMRTFHLKREGKVAGSGMFRVQLAGDGIRESDQVNGDGAVKGMTAAINQVKLPGALPPDSQARLLRDAVLDCSALLGRCDLVLTPQAGLRVEGVR